MGRNPVSGPDLSRMLTRVMGRVDFSLKVAMFDAYEKSDNTDDWPEWLRLEFDRAVAEM